MRILLLTPVFWPESFRINDLVQGLVDRGHDMDILAGMPNYPQGHYFPGYSWRGPFQENFGKARIIRFPVVPRGQGRPLHLALHYISWVFFGCIRILLMRSRGWERIFVFQTSPVTVAVPAFLARWRFRSPVILWAQDLWPEAVTSSGLIKTGITAKLLNWFSQWIYKSCDRVIAQSCAFEQSLASRGVPHERMAYVPNWAEDFYLDEIPATNPDGLKRFTILFAGNMGRGQGIDTIVAAICGLANYPEIHWQFAGDGALRPWLQEQVKACGLGDRVTFLPPRPPEQMPALFRAADALFVSLRKDPVYAMTIPGKLQSYLAAGKPILGCIDGEGARIIEESQAGLVARSEDAEDLAAQALKLARMDQATLDAMGKHGRQWFLDHFSREHCISALEAQIKLGSGSLASI